MTKLILCIDRDDDLGVKAGVTSPVIGREANIDAATKLLLSDPEDSDANTIFGGIKLYDEVIEQEPAEIVSIAGDKDVGVISDEKIASQLDHVIERLQADHVIVVSDGAEDESLMPVVQSRIKVNAVKRVVVRQSEKLESTFYIIKKAFEDPKINHVFFVPIGIASLLYAIFLLIEYPEGAVIAITGAIGIYMLYHSFGLDETWSNFNASMKQSLSGGKIAFTAGTASVILFVIATVQGAVGFWEYYNHEKFTYGYMILLMIFINSSIWWYVSAALSLQFGKIVDLYLSKESFAFAWTHVFFTAATGLLFWGASNYILSISSTIDEFAIDKSAGQQMLALTVIGAFIISVFGVLISTKLTRKDRTNHQ
jgi:putative membrane protein